MKCRESALECMRYHLAAATGSLLGALEQCARQHNSSGNRIIVDCLERIGTLLGTGPVTEPWDDLPEPEADLLPRDEAEEVAHG